MQETLMTQSFDADNDYFLQALISNLPFWQSSSLELLASEQMISFKTEFQYMMNFNARITPGAPLSGIGRRYVLSSLNEGSGRSLAHLLLSSQLD